jgi:hypothetical protein
MNHQNKTPTTVQTVAGATGFQQSKPILPPAPIAWTATVSTNDLDTPTGQRAGKAFTTLAAQLALQGHTLTRSNPNDGAVTYYVSRWGMVRALPDLEAVAAFARMAGGIAHV